MKKYVIFSGVYSDWNYHGYFDNEEDAKEYCTILNSNHNDYGDYYVEEVERIDLSNTKFYKEQYIIFDYDKNGKYEMREELDNYRVATNKDGHKMIFPSTYCYTIKFLYVSDDRKEAEETTRELMDFIMKEYTQGKTIIEICRTIDGWRCI